MKTQVLTQEATPLLRLYMAPAIEMTADQFFEFCQINRELWIERTQEGDLIIMTPTGGETSWRNSELVTTLNIWAKQDGTGIVFDSSAGFDLPNGAMRSPDAAWVKRSRLETLTPEEKKKFLPLCPDFVIELRSPSDRLADLKEKMVEYIENGVQLGWLIDPEGRQVFVYETDGQMTHLENPTTLSGEPLLTGFSLGLSEIWSPNF